MEQKLKGKPARIVGFTIGGLLIAFLLLSLIIKGKEVIDILEKNYYPNNTMVVNGEGKIMAMPDVAYISYNIETKNKEIKAAIEASKESINKFSSFLVEHGVKQNDIWVTNFNVLKNSEIDAEGKESFTYEVTEAIKIKIKDKEELAARIKMISDQALQDGMTFSEGYGYCNDSSEVDRVGLFIDNQDEYMIEIIKKALEDARKRAKQQAEMVGLKLGGIVNISDYSFYPNPCTAFVADFINPIEVKKSVSVTFEVKR